MGLFETIASFVPLLCLFCVLAKNGVWRCALGKVNENHRVETRSKEVTKKNLLSHQIDTKVLDPNINRAKNPLPQIQWPLRFMSPSSHTLLNPILLVEPIHVFMITISLPGVENMPRRIQRIPLRLAPESPWHRHRDGRDYRRTDRCCRLGWPNHRDARYCSWPTLSVLAIPVFTQWTLG